MRLKEVCSHAKVFLTLKATILNVYFVVKVIFGNEARSCIIIQVEGEINK